MDFPEPIPPVRPISINAANQGRGRSLLDSGAGFRGSLVGCGLNYLGCVLSDLSCGEILDGIHGIGDGLNLGNGGLNLGIVGIGAGRPVISGGLILGVTLGTRCLGSIELAPGLLAL